MRFQTGISSQPQALNQPLNKAQWSAKPSPESATGRHGTVPGNPFQARAGTTKPMAQAAPAFNDLMPDDMPASAQKPLGWQGLFAGLTGVFSRQAARPIGIAQLQQDTFQSHASQPGNSVTRPRSAPGLPRTTFEQANQRPLSANDYRFKPLP